MRKLRKRDEYAETFTHIAEIIEAARGRALQAVNVEMVACYWEVGRIITDKIQRRHRRADYGERLLARLAVDLTTRFGRGFSADNLNRMRQFYQAFPISGAVRQELSWTHYRKLLTIEDETKRNFYPALAIDAAAGYGRMISSDHQMAGVGCHRPGIKLRIAVRPIDPSPRHALILLK